MDTELRNLLIKNVLNIYPKETFYLDFQNLVEGICPGRWLEIVPVSTPMTTVNIVTVIVDRALREEWIEPIVDAIPRNASTVADLSIIRERLQRGAESSVARSSEQYPSDIGALPCLGLDERYVTHFVGRELQREDIEEALAWLSEGPTRPGPASRRRRTRLIWVCGLGGFGKSWLLRRVCIDAVKRDELKVCFIDWDSPMWRRPLTSWPLDAVETFVPIAYRLAQLYGREALNRFWDSLTAVRAYRRDYDDLRYAFGAALAGLSAAAPVSQHEAEAFHSASANPIAWRATRHKEALKRVLNGLRVRTDSKTEARLNDDPVLREQVFESWAERVAEHGDQPAAVRPNTVLCESLAQCVVEASLKQSLLLVVDTCEVLAPELDYWFMRLVTLAWASSARVVLVVGSRELPDVWRDVGARDGWTVDVPADQRRVIIFDETTCFSVLEIRAMLSGATRPLPNSPDLPGAVRHATLGIPFAVRTLVDLHEGGDDVLFELGGMIDEIGEVAVNESAARATVARLVSSRWLKHLTQSGSPDLDDIGSLALLLLPFRPALKAMWAPDTPQERLKRLGRNHSLLGGGDLHEIVRAFLRSHWRREPPPEITDWALRLRGALDSIRTDFAVFDEGHWDWLLERANVELWYDAESGGEMFAKHLCVAWAYDADVSRYSRLLDDAPVWSRRGTLREILGPRAELAFYVRTDEIVRWLEASERVSHWSGVERSCLKLLKALFESPTTEGATRHSTLLSRCRLFEEALDGLDQHPPRAAEVSTVYIDAAFKLTVGGDHRDVAERALRWLGRHGARDDADFVRANLLHNVGRFAEARDAYLVAAAADPETRRYPELPKFVTHLLLEHFTDEELPGRYQEALGFAARAVERAPEDLMTWQMLSHAYVGCGRIDEARHILEEALVEHPGHFGLTVSLALCLGRLGDTEEGARLLEAVSTASTDDEWCNGAAWDLYMARLHGRFAAQFARRAVSMNPESMSSLHTLLCVLAWLGEWGEVGPVLARLARSRYAKSLMWNDHNRGPARAILDLAAKDVTRLRALIAECGLKGEWLVLNAALEKWSDPSSPVLERLPDAERGLADEILETLRAVRLRT